MATELPSSVCFRVTRYCNAHCGFCLAPPDGIHPPAQVLLQRIDWLIVRGVRIVHFCGGEPTIHPALAQVIAYTRALGAAPKLTTNGISIGDQLLSTLVATRTPVKVSVHGDQARHDALVGRPAYDQTTGNLRRLLAAGIKTAMQTTVVAGSGDVIEWMVRFCLDLRVRQLNILPFIARGNGRVSSDRFALSCEERTALRAQVRAQRRAHAGRLDVRWLDFAVRPVPVVEVDGRLILEGASEKHDRVLAQLPGARLLRKRANAAAQILG